jgi:hypothetical protein
MPVLIETTGSINKKTLYQEGFFVGRAFYLTVVIIFSVVGGTGFEPATSTV